MCDTVGIFIAGQQETDRPLKALLAGFNTEQATIYMNTLLCYMKGMNGNIYIYLFWMLECQHCQNSIDSTVYWLNLG